MPGVFEYHVPMSSYLMIKKIPHKLKPAQEKFFVFDKTVATDLTVKFLV